METLEDVKTCKDDEAPNQRTTTPPMSLGMPLSNLPGLEDSISWVPLAKLKLH